jgi:hypothetical protein
MRFVLNGKQWFLRLTYGWEVDYLSKLPEHLWVPFRYINEISPAGAIHVGTLKVRLNEGHTYDTHRTLVLQCPLTRKSVKSKKRRTSPAPIPAYETVTDFL